MTAKRNLLERLTHDCRERPDRNKISKSVASPFAWYCRKTACVPSHSHAKTGGRGRIYILLDVLPPRTARAALGVGTVCVDVYVLLYLQGGVPKLAVAE